MEKQKEMDNQKEHIYKNFVFYKSWREALDGFKEDFGDEYAKEVLWNIMLFGTSRKIETEKSSIRGFVNGACRDNIISAEERYELAIENGKKGGRPKTVDVDEVIILLDQGLKHKEIAKQLGCSVDSIKAISSKYKKGKNLDIDKDIDIDIDIDNDIENDNDIEDISQECWYNNNIINQDDNIGFGLCESSGSNNISVKENASDFGAQNNKNNGQGHLELKSELDKVKAEDCEDVYNIINNWDIESSTIYKKYPYIHDLNYDEFCQQYKNISAAGESNCEEEDSEELRKIVAEFHEEVYNPYLGN